MRIISAVLEKKEGSGSSSRDCNCRRKIEILLMLGSRMMLGLFFPLLQEKKKGER